MHTANLPTSVVACDVQWPPLFPVLGVDPIPGGVVQVPDALQELHMVRLGGLVPGSRAENGALVLVQDLDEAFVGLPHKGITA